VGIESKDSLSYLPAFWAGKKIGTEIAEGAVNGILETHEQYKNIVKELIEEYDKEEDNEIKIEIEEDILV
jgi:hypothetical protein